jgi:hypothetical protein
MPKQNKKIMLPPLHIISACSFGWWLMAGAGLF